MREPPMLRCPLPHVDTLFATANIIYTIDASHRRAAILHTLRYVYASRYTTVTVTV